MTGESQKFANEGYALMGAAFEVHNILGGGLLEEIYQECLEIELGLRKISFESKRRLLVHYKDEVLEKRYIPDLFVSEQIVVEGCDPRSAPMIWSDWYL